MVQMLDSPSPLIKHTNAAERNNEIMNNNTQPTTMPKTELILLKERLALTPDFHCIAAALLPLAPERIQKK